MTPGSYSIQLHWDDGQGETTNISRSVLVAGNGGVPGTVVARPNLLTTSETMTTTFDGSGITGASSLNVKIYTLAGELVTSFTGPSGTGQALWNADGFASGIYIALVDVLDMNDGLLVRQSIKILVLH